MLLLAASACVWSEQFRQTHREEVQLERLPEEIGGWKGQGAPVHPGVAEMLKCDQVILRTFTDPLGREVQVYVMFWATPASTAHIHHPDVCWPRRGWQTERIAVRPLPLGDGHRPVPVSSRLYTQDRYKQMIYYWTQRGREVLPDGIEPPTTFLTEYAWVASMLRGGEPVARQARLSVLVGADVTGSPEQTEAKLQQFTAALAREVYRLCPWAVPGDPDGDETP